MATIKKPIESSEEGFNADQYFNTAATVPTPEEVFTIADTAKDPYYDHSQPVLISPEDVTGRTQKMHVEFIDASFRTKYHVQWIDEVKYSEYIARGFQPVRRDWVASSWTHALTKSNNNESDKIRMPVGIAEGGSTQYNILMFTTRELFDRAQTASYNSFNRLLVAKDSELDRVQARVLDEALIRRGR